ncbi:MAG: BMP family ABC transporter substrate-binding protein [Bacillota bacterium]|nr:BMP family ABC transporter substrate-binding protein [Bacillota bacterium]
MNYYNDAYKKGQNTYRKRICEGQDPFLTILDDLLPANKADLGQDIGLVYIPTELIVGTKTKGRSNLFTSDFMPLGNMDSEFAQKWENLANTHIEEGIRDPILVWEYMNRYYVQEGNKRTSVLKYFKSPQILAYVKRILPERTGDEQVELYYEYLDFSKYSKINNLEFSKPGSYKEFLKLLNKKEKQFWTEEETRKLNSTLYYFKKSFEKNKGDRLHIPLGDALLAYVRVFGYDTLSSQMEEQICVNLNKLWKEIELLEEEKQIEIKTEPPTKVAPTLLSNILFVKKHIAFIYRDETTNSGWRTNHEKGRVHAQQVLGDKICTKAYFCKGRSVKDTIIEAIHEGATIIFATGSTMWDDCLKLAVEYPSVRFFNCTINKPSKLVHSYYPRMYEGKFILGAIAGTLTKTNKIGYICKYPVYGVFAEINAFARGVRLVNPHAQVFVEWSSIEEIEQAEQNCISNQCDLISYRDYGNQDEVEKRMIGLNLLEDGKKTFVAVPIWDWGVFYEKILRSIIDGSMVQEEGKSKKSINYYWGISTGVVDVLFAQNLPSSVRYLGEILFRSIEQGICDPFYNPNCDPNGTYQWMETNSQYDVEQIVEMDYFEDNIIGTIPTFDQLKNEIVQEVVKNMGIKKVKDS